jgi:hypothetical protein
MTITRSRKIAGSTALRRVKPNAKRKERKTQKRKSRNKVMKGGVHPSLKVYVIQKKLGRPKCVIIKVTRTFGNDDIFLFFDAHVNQDEINEFVCAAMGAESTASITPALVINSREGEAEHNKFIKLSGIISYSIESWVFRGDRTPISDASLDKKHKIDPSPEIKTWDEVIGNLEKKTESITDYTFTLFDDKTVMANGEITKHRIVSLLDKIVTKTISDITEHCKNKPILDEIRELIRIIDTQFRIKFGMDQRARLLVLRKGVKPTKDEDKKDSIESAKLNFPTWDTDIVKGGELIQKIRSDSSTLNLCRPAIGQRELDKVKLYLDMVKPFQSIEEMATESYATTY